MKNLVDPRWEAVPGVVCLTLKLSFSDILIALGLELLEVYCLCCPGSVGVAVALTINVFPLASFISRPLP